MSQLCHTEMFNILGFWLNTLTKIEKDEHWLTFCERYEQVWLNALTEVNCVLLGNLETVKVKL